MRSGYAVPHSVFCPPLYVPTHSMECPSRRAFRFRFMPPKRQVCADPSWLSCSEMTSIGNRPCVGVLKRAADDPDKPKLCHLPQSVGGPTRAPLVRATSCRNLLRRHCTVSSEPTPTEHVENASHVLS
jgi:hypothetical protein